ncbi:MAG: hypothetical protein LBG15_07955 [Dysgonamonadaceae bacterium]|jgi:hypothetical protein|nr:hypothetical protein [Dysgonamonadaceae bacterium]
MIATVILIAFLSIYPVWLFAKLTRYGQGIVKPNFKRMQRKVDEWTGMSVHGSFLWNRRGGKVMYCLLCTCVLFVKFALIVLLICFFSLYFTC